MRPIARLTTALLLLAPCAAAFAAQGVPSANGSLESMSLLALLGFAFLGGLILNLMPCVLPVLSLKVMTLLDSGTSPSQARAHALWYTSGVLCAFATIGMSVVAL